MSVLVQRLLNIRTFTTFAVRRRAARHDILDFLREFSPLGVCDDGIGGVLMIRSRVSVEVAGLFQEFGRDSNVAVSMFSVI